MAAMTISLPEREYRRLIELAYLGEWMTNAQHDPEFHDDDARRLVQKLLAAHAPKLKDVEQDAETGEYYMTQDWIERLYEQYIMDYDDHVFWDELTERLAQRDLARQRGVDIAEISRDEDLLELRPFEERYHAELEDNGIERLEITGDYS